MTTDGSRRIVHARAARPAGLGRPPTRSCVAAGRHPNVEDLGSRGLRRGGRARWASTTDRRGRTTVGSIYVAGDLHGRFRYANVARYEGVSSVRDAFFPLWTNRADLFPWCTFTDPGAGPRRADRGRGRSPPRRRRRRVARRRRPHRAGPHRGHRAATVVVVTAKGRVVGAHLLAPRAGEMIHELALAIRQGSAPERSRHAGPRPTHLRIGHRRPGRRRRPGTGPQAALAGAPAR